VRYVEVGGLRLSAIGLGAWQFGTTGWGWGDEFGVDEAHRIIHRALELGINVIDTAELYSNGYSEQIVGEALKGQRDQAFIATKVSPWHALGGSVKRAAGRSLTRLDVDALDLYQVHWPNALVPSSWTMAGMRDLQLAGQVRHVGVSNYSLARWRKAEQALGSPVISNQVPYHLLRRNPEQHLLPYAQTNDRLIIAYSPLAQGILSGRYGPGNVPGGARRFNSLFTAENLRRAEPVVNVLREVGEAHSATPAQIALAWLVHQPNVVAIPGAKSVAQLEANAAAADIELSQEELRALDMVSARFTPAGQIMKYPKMAARLLFR
jgi:aryl-alcohol dehydrogenase-like predicted oxidoreductase